MSRTPWSLAPLLLVVAASAQAAEGTHPGPLPPPHDATAAAPASPDYAYPGQQVEGFGSGQPYGSAPGYGATPGYPQDWAGGQAPGSYGYAPAPGYAQPGGYGYEAYPGGGGATGRDQPRGYWIWVPAEAVESTIGGHRGPQAPYGGQDYGYPAYPVYPEGATSGGYSTPAPGYAGQGGPAYPDYGSGGPAPGDGWWGPGATGGRPFGDPATQADSRASGTPPPGPEPAHAAGTRPAATEAGRPPAATDGDGAFRPTPRPEPGVGGN